MLSMATPSTSTYSSYDSSPPEYEGSDGDEEEEEGFLVFCRYDFDSEDPDQITFRQGDVLRIVQTQDNGWWAALDNEESKIGWVPSDFVEPMSQEMLYSYSVLRKELETARADQTEFDDAGFSPVDSGISPANLAVPQPGGQPSPAGRQHPFKIERIPGTNRTSIRMTMLSDIHATVPPQPRAPPQPSPYTTTAHPGLPFNRPRSDSVPLNNAQQAPVPEHAPTDRALAPKEPLRSQTVPVPAQPAINVNKAVPPTPGPSSEGGTLGLSRSRSASATTASTARPRPRPSGFVVNDSAVLNRISLAVDGTSSRDTSPYRHPNASDSNYPNMPNNRGRAFNDLSVDTGSSTSSHDTQPPLMSSDKDTNARINTFESLSRTPWYLRPAYSEGKDILFDNDGTVRGGVTSALVERLTVDPGNFNAFKAYRHAFLLTFKSFTSADTVFELLEKFYRQGNPPDLTEEQFLEWRERKQKVAQTRILVVLREWLEDHHLLQEDPQIGPRLREFLILIKSPPTLQLTAKQTLQSLDRLYSTPPRDPYESTSKSASGKSAKRLNKALGTDILKIDASLLAMQLTLLEARLYSRVRPSECLAYCRAGGVNNGVITLKGEKNGGGPLGSMQNLIAFCATNDKLAAWVKMSVLERDGLGKRADTIEHWIKVAEKCRALLNISSTSAIVAALSSVDIRQLNLTWAHVGRTAQFQQLVRLTDPAGNFSTCRAMLTKTEGACVPFVGMYLSDLVHYNDRFDDYIPAPVVSSSGNPSAPIPAFTSPQHPTVQSPAPMSAFSPMQQPVANGPRSAAVKLPPTSPPSKNGNFPSAVADGPLPRIVNWVKRMYIANIVDSILTFQPRTYDITEDQHLYAYIENRLQVAANKDQGSFWLRSQEVQQAEIAHADIRRGLEQAGF